MASESAEEGTVTVSLGPELEEWLDAQATALGVDRETVLLRLVAMSRTADLDGVADADDLAAVLAEAEPVQAAVASVADDLAEEQTAAAIEAAVAKQVEAAVDQRVDDELGPIEADFQNKIEDVRERVIQVKQEADAKAPAEHSHEEFDRFDAIGHRLADVEEGVATLETTVAELAEDVERIGDDVDAVTAEDDEVSELADTVESIQERLKTVAWVVSDLREAQETQGGSAALEQLKRSAAEADTARANCERCGEGVEIGLLTEPSCPHCDATVTRVTPAEGFFGKPQLLVASQLESGEE